MPSVCRETVPFVDGSGEEGQLSVAGGAVRCLASGWLCEIRGVGWAGGSRTC